MFKKAVKHESKLRMAIAGPSGSGKTYTALSIAVKLGKVAFVDTESGSASKYADLFDFDVAEIHAPFHPKKYIDAIKAATDAGYDVVVLDSLSHAWSGTGGILDIVDEAAKRIKGNSYMAWKEGTPIQNRLIDAIVTTPIHIIGTMRSKTEYTITQDSRGKNIPKKLGMAPIQRDGFEYEFDIMMDMDIDNNGIVTKSRCPELSGRVFAKPNGEVSDILKNWLSGEPSPVTPTTNAPAPPPQEAHPVLQKPTSAMVKKFHALGNALYIEEPGGWDAKRPMLVKHVTGGRSESSSHLTRDEMAKLIEGMEAKAHAVSEEE